MPDRADDIDPGLERRLTDYVASLPAAEPPEPGFDPRAPRRRWIVSIATAGAAMTAGAVLGLALLDGSRPDVADASAMPSATPPASMSAEPTPTASSPTRAPTPTATPQPTATPAPSIPDRWTLARVVPIPDDSSPGPNMRGVVWHPGPGFIAYGSQANEPGSPPGIWTSADGSSWQLASIRGNLAGYSVEDVAWTTGRDPRFVAIANRFEPSPRATVLVSNDGITWVEASTPENATYLQSVTHGPEGFIAVGDEEDLTSFESDGRVWRSTDGLAWTELDPPSVDRTSLLAVEVVGERYVAAGFPDRPSPPMTAWVSADGLEWSSSAIVPSSGVGCICAATGSNGAEVIVGGVKDNTFVASSSDWTTWSVTALESDFGATVEGLAVLDDSTVVATGSFDVADGPRGVLIWVRDAGTSVWRSVSWQDRLPDVDPAEVDLGGAAYLAVAHDRTVILVADGTVLVTSDRIP